MNYLPEDWIVYYFTDSEMKLLDAIAKFRNKKTNERTGNQNKSGLDDFKITQWGVYAEYVVAKKLNLFFDWNCEYRVPFPMDLISQDGKTVDVKCTQWFSNRLNVKQDNYKQKPDYYVATQFLEGFDGNDVLQRCVRIVGFICANKFEMEHTTGHNEKTGPYQYIG